MARKTERKTARSAGNKAQKSPAGQHYSKHWFILFFMAVLVLAILVIRPFISALLIGAVIAYVLYPLYRRINRAIPNESLAAGIVVMLLVMVLAAPFALFASHVAKESIDIYHEAQIFYDEKSAAGFCADSTGIICESYSSVLAFAEDRGIDIGEQLTNASGGIISALIKALTSFLLNLPSLLFHIFITLFIIFFLLIDGEKMLETLKSALPIKREHSDSIFKQFNDVIYATIYGAIIIAIIQGTLAFAGFMIFDAPSPIILGLLTVIFAFVPFIGTAIVWLPVSATMMINGAAQADNTLAMKGIGLFVYAILVISMADNILRPKIVGDRANIHPLLILLGVFGGIAVFGFAGVIIGPLALTLFTTALKIYEKEKEYILNDG